MLTPDDHPDVPMGARLVMELPQELKDDIVADAKRRREES